MPPNHQQRAVFHSLMGSEKKTYQKVAKRATLYCDMIDKTIILQFVINKKIKLITRNRRTTLKLLLENYTYLTTTLIHETLNLNRLKTVRPQNVLQNQTNSLKFTKP